MIDVLVHKELNDGKGAAIRTRAPPSTGNVVIVQDADLEYDPADWPRLLEPIIEGKADAVLRVALPGRTRIACCTSGTASGNSVLTTVSNMFTNLNLTDMETCYKAIRGDLARSLVLTADRFGFEPEVTARLRAGGRPYLGSTNWLLRAHVRRGKEDRMEGRRRGVLAYHQVQSILMNVRWSRWATPFIAVLALASSAVGIVNRFTYDDRYIIQLNPVMRSLDGWWRAFQRSYWPKDWGGDGYRPLTMLAFPGGVDGGRPESDAVPRRQHLALCRGVCPSCSALAKRFLPAWAAWITAALFAVHPVHVEAVANVVGQAELLVAAALVSATILYVRDRQSGALQLRTVAIIAVLYTIACLSKEHGIVLPAILVAAELTVIEDTTAWRARMRSLRPFFLFLTAIAVAFIWARSLVLAEHGGIGGFQPFTPFQHVAHQRSRYVCSRRSVLCRSG